MGALEVVVIDECSAAGRLDEEAAGAVAGTRRHPAHRRTQMPGPRTVFGASSHFPPSWTMLGTMKPPRARRATPLIGLCGLLAACGSPSGANIGSPPPRHYGSEDADFSIATAHSLREVAASKSPGSSEWWSANTVVRVVPVSPLGTSGLVDTLRRNLLPTSKGTHVTVQGHRAVEDIGNCSTPSGACPGKVGSLLVLDGPTIYWVFTEGLDASSTQRVLDSLHIDG